MYYRSPSLYLVYATLCISSGIGMPSALKGYSLLYGEAGLINGLCVNFEITCQNSKVS